MNWIIIRANIYTLALKVKWHSSVLCTCVCTAELLMIWQHRETAGGSNNNSVCVTHFIQRTYRQTSQCVLCWTRLGPCVSSVVITTNTSNTVWHLHKHSPLFVWIFLSLHPSWFLYLTAIWFHPSHTHKHAEPFFMAKASAVTIETLPTWWYGLWQHDFSIISFSRSSPYQHNSATFKRQLTVLLWWPTTIRFVKMYL